MNSPVYLVSVVRKVNQIQLPITFAVLTNILKCNGIGSRFLDLLPVELDRRESFFRSQIPKVPTIFGFTITAGNDHINETDRYAQLVKSANPAHVVVYGGPLPTAVPSMILENCPCDYVIAGEGELSFPSLIKALRAGDMFPDGIPGLYYRKDGIVTGVHRKAIRKLDSLSMPDYSQVDVGYYVGYLHETDQSFELMGSRGCAGDCSFCYKFMGKGISIRSVDSVLDEIASIMDKYKMRKFYFIDENFLQYRKVFLEFVARRKERGMDFEFIGQARMDSIDEEICRIGAENGLTCLSSGIESVVQETLDRVNKKLTVERIERTLKLTRDYGIPCQVSFIVGFPWDKAEDYEELLRFIERNKIEKRCKIHYLTPLPATKIYGEAVEDGQIGDEMSYIRALGDLYWERAINLTSLPDDVLDGYHRRLYNIGSKEPAWPKSERYLSTIRKIH